jgi:hypothetical protein
MTKQLSEFAACYRKKIFPAGNPAVAVLLVTLVALNCCWVVIPCCSLAPEFDVVGKFPGALGCAIIFAWMGALFFSSQLAAPRAERGSFGKVLLVSIASATGLYAFTWAVSILLVVLGGKGI